MKKTSKIVICTVIIIAVLSGTLFIIDHQRMKNNEPVLFSTWGRKYSPAINSFSAAMCSARKLVKDGKGTYLEIVFDDEKNTVKTLAVKDEALIKKLSETSLDKIIGVNIAARIPGSVFDGKAQYYKTDTLQFLIDYDDYDKYFEITDISLR